MSITPLDVHEQTFRVVFRGFDPLEVDAFLQRVADELERLNDDRDRLQRAVEHEQQARGSLEEALGAARALEQGVLERAREEAELLRHQAQLQADRVLAQANEDLLRLRREIQEVRARRDLLVAETEAAARALVEWLERGRGRDAADADGPPLIADPGEEPAAAERPDGEPIHAPEDDESRDG